MAKIAPRDLAQVLSTLPKQPFNDNVLVGYDTSDDAGVFRFQHNVAFAQTIDFFTPIVDDPELYGRIAAINALNDIYAMGGTPLTALTIVCYPQEEELSVLGKILQGGQSAMNEAGVIILGGHSINDDEIKFGYAVTGIINPTEIVTNASSKSGDALVLTKPIGTGAISTGIKNGIASLAATEAAITVMTQSGAIAAEAMRRERANACTDITGFGLLGHAYEIAKASNVTLIIESKNVQLLPDVLSLIRQGMLTRGDKNNKEYVGDAVKFAESVSSEMRSALFDPQTAGGLLISIDKSKAERLAAEVNGFIIGEVLPKAEHLIKVL